MQEVSGSSPLSSTTIMAKTHILYAHLADQSFPSEGGKLNIIGVFAGIGNPGTIGVAKFPSVYPRLAMAIGLATTKKELPVTISFRDESGTDVVSPFSGTFQIDRQGAAKAQESANVNFNLNFDTFQLAKPGKLTLTIESDGDELAELELNVVQVEQQQQPPPQAFPTKE